MPSTTDRIDRELAAKAMAKRRAGETPKGPELAALRRIEKAQEEERRWEYYKAIPKKHWVQMSGRQTKILHDQCDTHGIPLRGKTIDLGAVVKWLHDFLASKQQALIAISKDTDPLMSGGDSPALEQYRLAKAQLAELDLEERLGSVMLRADVQEWMSRFCALFREAGERVQRQYGPDAQKYLDEACDQFQREVEKAFEEKANG